MGKPLFLTLICLSLRVPLRTCDPRVCSSSASRTDKIQTEDTDLGRRLLNLIPSSLS